MKINLRTTIYVAGVEFHVSRIEPAPESAEQFSPVYEICVDGHKRKMVKPELSDLIDALTKLILKG